MFSKLLIVDQALEYFNKLDSDKFSADLELICLSPKTSVVTDEDIAENNLCDKIPFNIPGETETNAKNLNDADSEEDYNLPKNEIKLKQNQRCSKKRKRSKKMK